MATDTAANSLGDGGSSSGGSEPIASVRVSISGGSGGKASVFDRVVLTEDQTKGQIVRGWIVEWSPDSGAHWEVLGQGQSIGNKRIVLAKGAMSHVATDVRLNITAAYGGTPHAVLKVHAPCLTGTIDTIRKIGTEDIGMTGEERNTSLCSVAFFLMKPTICQDSPGTRIMELKTMVFSHRDDPDCLQGQALSLRKST